MSRPLTAQIILAPSVILMVALSGCATYRGCTTPTCTGDQKITSEIERLLDEYPALAGPIPITVQTKDGIVYLNGQVATDLERYTAESVSLQATGVAMVVNGIAVTEK
jgi:osmotically-inducible protein OsmY